MNILEKIVHNKRVEIQEVKKSTRARDLENSLFFDADRPSFFQNLSTNGPSIIAEFKRRSPSKGIINDQVKVEEVVFGYEKAGASAVSILTDIHFDGAPSDIQNVFRHTQIPILRKDFILDEIQVYEARAWGASAILLIAAVLQKKEIESLAQLAHSMGLDVLLEIHEEEELDKIPGNIRIVGINNRNLKTFHVDMEQSIRLAGKLPSGVLKVSESGIGSADVLLHLYRSGFTAFLMGENFMKEKDPGMAASEFIKEIGRRMQD